MNFRKIIAWTIIVVACVFALSVVLAIAQYPEGRKALLIVAGIVSGCVAVGWAIYEVS